MRRMNALAEGIDTPGFEAPVGENTKLYTAVDLHFHIGWTEAARQFHRTITSAENQYLKYLGYIGARFLFAALCTIIKVQTNPACNKSHTLLTFIDRFCQVRRYGNWIGPNPKSFALCLAAVSGVLGVILRKQIGIYRPICANGRRRFDCGSFELKLSMPLDASAKNQQYFFRPNARSIEEHTHGIRSGALEKRDCS